MIIEGLDIHFGQIRGMWYSEHGMLQCVQTNKTFDLAKLNS